MRCGFYRASFADELKLGGNTKIEPLAIVKRQQPSLFGIGLMPRATQPQHTPAEQGGLVVFFAVLDDGGWRVVTAARHKVFTDAQPFENPAFALDSYPQRKNCKIKSPLALGVKLILASQLDLFVVRRFARVPALEEMIDKLAMIYLLRFSHKKKCCHFCIVPQERTPADLCQRGRILQRSFRTALWDRSAASR